MLLQLCSSTNLIPTLHLTESYSQFPAGLGKPHPPSGLTLPERLSCTLTHIHTVALTACAHTHLHTCLCTFSCTKSHKYTHKNIRLLCTHNHTPVLTRAHPRTQTHLSSHTQTQMCAPARRSTQAYSCAHPHVHRLPCTLNHARSRTHLVGIRVLTRPSPTNNRTLTPACAHPHVLSHTRAHTCSHTLASPHIHSRTYVHAHRQQGPALCLHLCPLCRRAGAGTGPSSASRAPRRGPGSPCSPAWSGCHAGRGWPLEPPCGRRTSRRHSLLQEKENQ